MLVKPLMKPNELKVFEALEERLPFSNDEKLFFHQLRQGYLGEQYWENLLVKRVEKSFFIVSDLRLQVSNQSFQIDSLLISNDRLYLLEVKHYTGDYIFEETRWFKIPSKEVSNPLLQLHRSESLLRRWLQRHSIHIPIESYLIFTNDHFFLYQAPKMKQMVFPNQLHRFISSLHPKATMEINQQKLIELLMKQDLGEYPHPHLPIFSFQSLQKGIRCHSCRQLSLISKQRHLLCLNCKVKESIEQGFLRHLTELQILFPNHKLTTKLLHDWSDQIVSMKTIKRLLDKYFQPVGKHRWTYYIK